MSTKALMGSVSSVAMVIAGAQQAAADSLSALSGYTLNVQGGVGAVDSVWNDKFESSGGSSGPGDKIGVEERIPAFMGSMSLSRQTAPNKDMAFGLSFGVSQDDAFSFSSSFSGSAGSGSVTFTGGEGLSFAALDFEMGTTVPSGVADMRWFYGARALATKSTISADIDVDKAGSGGSGMFEAKSEYLGVGPRVGIGFATQPVPGSQMGQFGLSGEIGAAVLFGSRKDTFSSSYSSGGVSSSFSSGSSERKTVTSLDAQIGVDYYLSDNATISVGYQLQQFWNVDLMSDEDNSSDYAGPRLVQGVFIGFTTQF